jgi:undecaprenyl-diphosphatase
MKNTKGRTRILISFILLAIVITISFGLIVSKIILKDTQSLDQQLLITMQSLQGPLLITIMRVITFLGSKGFLPPLLLILIYALYTRWGFHRRSFILAFNLAGAYISTEIIKNLIKRPRPDLNQLTYASGFSFPSIHAMVSLSFYGLLAYLIWNNAKTPILRWGLSILLILLGLVIGASRIFLGVHYPTDVLGGYLLGIVWLIISIIFFKFLNSRRQVKN